MLIHPEAFHSGGDPFFAMTRSPARQYPPVAVECLRLITAACAGSHAAPPGRAFQTGILTASRWLIVMGILCDATSLGILCLQVGTVYVTPGEIFALSDVRSASLGSERRRSDDRYDCLAVAVAASGPWVFSGRVPCIRRSHLASAVEESLGRSLYARSIERSALGVSVAVLFGIGTIASSLRPCRSAGSSEACWRCSSSIACRRRMRGCRSIACSWPE